MLPCHLGGYAVSQLWQKSAANKAIQPSWSGEEGRMFMETSAIWNGAEQVMDSSSIKVCVCVWGGGGEGGHKKMEEREKETRQKNAFCYFYHTL